MQKSVFSKEYELFLGLLRSAREATGVTQEDLATRLGTTQSLVSKCERGERRLDVVELRSWCYALGIAFPGFVKSLEKELLGSGQRK